MKKFSMGFLITAILFSSITIYAAGSNMIEVFYNVNDIKINGQSNMPEQKPFIYNGSTFVPLRYVSETLGYKVGWDGNTGTVLIDDTDLSGKLFLSDLKPYIVDNIILYKLNNSNNSEYTYSAKYSWGYSYPDNYIMTSAGKKYYKGIAVTPNDNGVGKMFFNLNGQYNKLSGSIAFEDLAFDRVDKHYGLRFYLDEKLIKEINMSKGDLPKDINMSVTGGLQLKIEFVKPGDDNSDNPNINLLNFILE